MSPHRIHVQSDREFVLGACPGVGDMKMSDGNLTVNNTQCNNTKLTNKTLVPDVSSDDFVEFCCCRSATSRNSELLLFAFSDCFERSYYYWDIVSLKTVIRNYYYQLYY